MTEEQCKSKDELLQEVIELRKEVQKEIARREEIDRRPGFWDCLVAFLQTDGHGD